MNLALRILYFLIGLLFLNACAEKVQESIVLDGYPYYEKAANYLEELQVDSAFLMFEEASSVFAELNDSLNVANSFIRMAIIQRDAGDYYGAQEVALQAVEWLNPENPNHRLYLGIAYNNLAMASRALGDSDNSFVFYELALKFSNDISDGFVIRNNLAIFYRSTGDYDHAFSIFQDIIDETRESNSKEYARVLSNYAVTKSRKDSLYNAAPELLLAMHIREQENDRRGLNASYAHLSDYYANNKPDSAIFYAKKQYNMANRIKNPDSRLRALDRLITLSPSDSSKRYYTQYKQISDSLQQARTAAKNQFAVIRYEVEKSKAENLRLEKESAERNSRLIRQRVFTGILLLLIISGGVGGRYWYRKRQQRLELAAQNRIKESQLKTSRRVHDVVANGIYRVMSDIEYKDAIDREDLLDKLEDMYHKSRDISYETEEPVEYDQSFHEHTTGLIKSFASDSRTVFIVGNEPEIWHSFDHTARAHIRHVLQELMVNMDKHSQAENVVVRFEKTGDHLSIHYSDDGIGIKKDTPHGNGLTSTVSRIESLQGKITFVPEVDKGLKIEIMIPSL